MIGLRNERKKDELECGICKIYQNKSADIVNIEWSWKEKLWRLETRKTTEVYLMRDKQYPTIDK